MTDAMDSGSTPRPPSGGRFDEGTSHRHADPVGDGGRSVSSIRVVEGRAGRLRSEGERDIDRIMLSLSHLWPVIGAFTATLPLIWMAPLVVWMFRKDGSPLVDDQGREIINTLLTMCVVSLMVITVIGIPFVLVWYVVWLIACIRGAIAVGHGEYFRYPMTLRFID